MRVMIEVETYDGDSDEAESVRTIDHNDTLHRQWLAKHCWWALRNNRTVVTTPIKEESE